MTPAADHDQASAGLLGIGGDHLRRAT